MLRLTGVIPRFGLTVSVSLPIVYFICVAPLAFLLYIELTDRRSRSRQPRGCRKLGLKSCSNLADEHSYNTRGVHKRSKDDAGKKIRVKALIVYPIKSCAGVEFNFIDGTDTGLMYDRQFAFAEYVETRNAEGEPKTNGSAEKNATTGRWDCRTLRDGKFSRMALVRPEIWIPDPSLPSYSPKAPAVRSKGVLVINYPRIATSFLTKLGMKLNLCSREESFQVPLYPPDGEYPSIPFRIFRDTPNAYNYGDHIPSSLATFLGSTKPLSLFRVDPDHYRPVRGNAPPAADLGFEPTMGFPDEYPVQMQNLASIRNIAEQVQYAIPKFSVRRFRPNIVLEGLEAYDEDDWKRIRIVQGPRSRKAPPSSAEGDQDDEHKDEGKGVDVIVACRTVRCRLPNVDPDTGERHQVEPDKTLRSMRNIDAGAGKSGCLGMMLVPVARKFTLHVGDEIEVRERGEHFYVKG
ncbi:MOSC domain-containing protein [Coccidioides immitis RS]|uniref:MOSC domain-containing protein n=3 Tax=Coccidioides immitis TaxID=5501 RepID=J3K4X9_COCIM|nr:MOSC domain-containing protein [Coccidioides immitis RS]EAS29409.3 MOSC domain-containing protein [Coccidioides immitis RS]KMP06552.1 MOSC domain containing protein [Coccidioides immitis RMSCC 2394]KMU84122.1 MOSC domain-containing protein [Coccidioides immitis H538.4]TPX22504.1 hypothetical protein DIZ76_014376 [Coccidioides immitis]